MHNDGCVYERVWKAIYIRRIFLIIFIERKYPCTVQARRVESRARDVRVHAPTYPQTKPSLCSISDLFSLYRYTSSVTKKIIFNDVPLFTKRPWFSAFAFVYHLFQGNVRF